MNEHLLDALIERHKLKNDAALFRLLGLSAPAISNMRAERLTIGPGYILNIHLATDMPIATIKGYLAIGRPEFRFPKKGGAK